MKKLLVITYYFPPAGGAGVQRWLKFVKYLPEFGYEPTVLTVDPAFASYPQTDESLLADVPENLRLVRTETKEILGAYKKLSPNKQVPYGGFANEQSPTLFQKLSRFVRGNFFLPDPRKGWNKFALPKAIELLQEGGYEAFVTTGPPHSTHLLGLELKKRFPDLKWIADLRDPWTDIYYNKLLYQTAWARKRNLEMEKAVLLAADRLITVSQGVCDNFCAHADVRDKFAVIPNGYDESDFENLPEPPVNEKLVISYIGTLSPLYESASFVEALKLLPAEECAKIKLRIIGKLGETIAEEFSKTAVEIDCLPYMTHSEAVGCMRASDLLLLLLPAKDSTGVLTGKLFEYMASGRPVLLIEPEKSEAGDLLRQMQAGEVFGSGNAQLVAEYLSACIKKRPVSRALGVEKFSRYNLTKSLACLL